MLLLITIWSNFNQVSFRISYSTNIFSLIITYCTNLTCGPRGEWKLVVPLEIGILIKFSAVTVTFMDRFRAGQYLNTLYLNTVFKYIYCIYTLYLNTFFNLFLITVFKYFWSVFKYMYLNTFLNAFLHTPLNINNRNSVDWSANHGFKHFNAGTCCICLLLNNTVLYPL